MQRMTKLNGLDIIDLSRGVANGVASLNEQGRIPDSQIPTVHNADDLQLKEGLPISLLDWRNNIGEAYVWKETNSWKDILGQDTFSVGCSEDCIVYTTVTTTTTTPMYHLKLYTLENGVATQRFTRDSYYQFTSAVITHLHDSTWRIRLLASGTNTSYVSFDNGATWSDVNVSIPFMDALCGNNTYIVVELRQNRETRILRSTDGVNFTIATTLTDSYDAYTKGSLMFVDGVWFLSVSSVGRVWRSLDDGLTWSSLDVSLYYQTLGPLVQRNSQIFLFVHPSQAQGYKLATPRASSFSYIVADAGSGNILYANGYWYAGNASHVLRRTKNLSSWETCTLPVTLPSQYLIAFANNKYFLLTASALYISEDGLTFTLLRTMTSTIPASGTYMWDGNSADKQLAPFIYYRKGVWIVVRYGSNGISWSNDLLEWNDEAGSVYSTYPTSMLIISLCLVNANATLYRNNNEPLFP